jgi:hypothetical protein
MPPDTTTDLDSYPLRGLLVCGTCHDPLHPAATVTGARVYACPAPGCRAPIRAADVEQITWARYTARHEATAAATPRDRRRDALVDALTAITVGTPWIDLDYTWRD